MPDNRLPGLQLSLRQRAALALKTAVGIFTNEPGAAIQFLNALYPAGFGPPPKRGTPQFLLAYSQMPWLRAVTGQIASRVAATTWHVYAIRSKGQRAIRNRVIQRAAMPERRKMLAQLKAAQQLEEITEHPILDLLHNSNPYLTGGSARKLTQIYLDIVGEAFWLKERNALGIPIAIWPIPPSWVQQLPSPQNPRYLVRFGRITAEIPDPEILWMQDPDPANPYWRGTGIANSLSDELETDEYAAKHLKGFFYNRARPDFIVTVKPGQGGESIKREELLRLQNEWLNQHETFWRAFKPHFTNRELDIHEFDQNFQHMQMVELRQNERDTIRQVYGLPPEILGITESSNRATADAASYIVGKNVVEPRLEFQREMLQERLVPEYDDRIVLDYDSPVPNDQDYILKAAQAAPWSIYVDEWRAMQDLPPIENGGGKVFMVPIVMSPTADLGADAPPPPDPEPAEPEPTDGSGKGRRLTRGRKKEPDALDADGNLLVHRIADRLEPKLRRAFLEAIARMKGEINADDLRTALLQGNVQGVLDALKIDGMAEALSGIRNVLQSAVQAAGELAASQLSQVLGVELTFDHTNALAVQYVKDHAGELIGGITDDQRASIKDIIQQAFEEGLHPTEAAKLIRDHIGLTGPQSASLDAFRAQLEADGVEGDALDARVSRYAQALVRQRSITIARTETISASNRGQQLLWEQATRDHQLVKDEWEQEWIVTPDDRLDRTICEPMPYLPENAHVPIGGMFTTGVGDQIPGPAAHPRCRRAVALRRRSATSSPQRQLSSGAAA